VRRVLPWLLASAASVLAVLSVRASVSAMRDGRPWVDLDLGVYLSGAAAVRSHDLYDLLFGPVHLPFTYPPFAAFLAIPLALLPFGVVGWLWTALQVIATTATVWYAAHRLLHRTGGWMPLALAAATAPMIWLHPVSDGIRFGQVNAFIVLACLMDLRDPRPGLVRRVPQGVLVGLAMAVKLTPGVFVVHFLVTRRYREAATAVGTAVAVTLAAWVLLPQASFAFWGGALQDPARLGPNMGTSNQSMRGFLLRVGPDGLAGTAIWLVLVAVVGAFGFWLARRLFRAGDSIGEVAVVGLLACLLSPVAWIHHFHWVVVVVFALLGADPLRERRRLWAGLGVTAFFLCRLPWWGIDWLNHPSWPAFPGRVLQNADVFGALAALWLLWWAVRPGTPSPDATGGAQRTPVTSSAV